MNKLVHLWDVILKAHVSCEAFDFHTVRSPLAGKM